MKYAILYSPDALADVLDFLRQPGVLDCFEQAMERLAQSPAKVSKPSRVPYPQGQAYTFSCNTGPGQAIGFRVHFRYHANETDLEVFAVTADRYWRL